MDVKICVEELTFARSEIGNSPSQVEVLWMNVKKGREGGDEMGKLFDSILCMRD